MKFEEGQRVEVSGDPEDPGFAGSWWTAVVVRQQRRGRGAGQITVCYDELLEDDGVTKAEETVHFSRVRPACADDSCTKPLADRQPGDPVDCWHDDGWWEGYVHRVFDEHITVFFPASNEEYTDIYPPAKPLDPTAHRVRTGRNWDVQQRAWVARPHKAYEGSANHRNGAAAAAPAAPPALAEAAAPQAAGVQEQQDSSSEDDVPLIARKATAAAAGGTPNAGQQVPKGAPSKAAQPSAKPAIAEKSPAPAAAAAAMAAQPAARPPTQQAAVGGDDSSSDDQPLVLRVRAAAQAAGQRAQQQEAQQRPIVQQQQQQTQRQQQAPPAAQKPAAAPAPAAKQGGGPGAGASAPAGKAAAATAHKASESPEGGLAAANASVADLLTSLDAGDEDEGRREGSKAVAAAAPPAVALAPGAAPAPAGASAAAAKQAAPAAAAAKQVVPPAAAAKQVVPPAAAASKPRVEASAPAAAGAPAAAKPQAAPPPAAAAAATKAAAPAPRQQSAPKPSVQRQQSAPKQPLQRQQSAPARPVPLQLPTGLADLKAPPPKRQQQQRQQQQQQQQQQPESPLHRQQSGLQLPTSLADLKAPPPKRQRQDVLQTEPPLQKQASDVQQRKQAQQARPEQRQQDVRQPPATHAQQQQQQQQPAAAGKGKAAPAAKPVQRIDSKGAGRSGGAQPSVGKAAAASSGGAQRLAPLIPKRSPAGESGALESPRALASPRQQPQPQQPPLQPPPQQHADGSAVGEGAARKRPREEKEAPGAAPAAAAVRAEADRDHKRGRIEGPPPPPAAPPAPAAAAAVARPAPRYDPNFPTVWCLDNLPASISSTILQQALGGIGLKGVKSVEVAGVPLDVGDRHGGYAVLRFFSAADAQREYDKLHSLCIRTPTCPIPRPLIIRQPRIREGYAWGPEARLPGHFPLDFQANQHFVQPNSIEFDLAIEWRQALGQLAVAKQELCMEQATELAEQMAGYLKVMAQPQPAIVTARLQLPGEGLGPGGGAAAGEGATSASSCVWLSGVLASATEEQLIEAFAQFGFPQQAHLVRDPVTGKPSSHAVLWMESNQRARDLVQNLREMVYVLNGTPRAVDASLAVPGPARGSQSTYDRALRCVFAADDSQLAGSVDFVVVKDEEALELPSAAELGQLPAADRADAAARRATIALRRLLRSHRKEQDELAHEKRQRLHALDARQRQHFADEKLKLGRLAAIQHQQIGPSLFLIDHLLDRHNIQGVRVYRNKESAKLMRYADEQRAAQQRAAAEQQRAALKQRAPARQEPSLQRAAARPKR